MDEFLQSQARYLRAIERRSRAKGVSVTDYLANPKTSTLFEDELKPASPPPRKEVRPEVRPVVAIVQEEPLPHFDAVVSICVAEPKGRYKFDLVIPEISELLVDSLRNERGYKQAFIEAILFKFFGQIPG